MQITHFCNAFNSVKINKTVIACDPWVGAGNQTSWISYPIHKNGANILRVHDVKQAKECITIFKKLRDNL